MDARNYDPETASWLRRDLYNLGTLLLPANAQGLVGILNLSPVDLMVDIGELNGYAYVSGGSFRYVDWTGLQAYGRFRGQLPYRAQKLYKQFNKKHVHVKNPNIFKADSKGFFGVNYTFVKGMYKQNIFVRTNPNKIAYRLFSKLSNQRFTRKIGEGIYSSELYGGGKVYLRLSTTGKKYSVSVPVVEIKNSNAYPNQTIKFWKILTSGNGHKLTCE